MKELFTIQQTINARGDEQFNIYKDGQLVGFAFDEAYANIIIDEMIRFPRYAETVNCRFD